MTAGTLNGRLARLEAATGGVAGHPTIFVQFMAPAGTNPMVATATLGDQVWHRAEGEEDETFIARVSADCGEASRPWGRVVFLD